MSVSAANGKLYQGAETLPNELTNGLQSAQPSFPRKRGSRRLDGLWILALRFATAGMTAWVGARTFSASWYVLTYDTRVDVYGLA
jgi:hypothetical protein